MEHPFEGLKQDCIYTNRKGEFFDSQQISVGLRWENDSRLLTIYYVKQTNQTVYKFHYGDLFGWPWSSF